MLDHSVHDRVRVSVVIATLGGDSLRDTIDHLNSGSIAPAEILVCIPENEPRRLVGYSHPNVRILVTSMRGQVAQRIEGFRRAANDLVMQLDDDIVVDKHCVAVLVREMQTQRQPCAIAPSFKWLGTKDPVYKPVSPPALAKAFSWLVDGRSACLPGTVTRAGAEVGVYGTCGVASVESEWLPGGCVLHHRANLVLDNYFPFGGKAYCEDLIHSYHLRSRAVRLIVSTNAVAYIRKPEATPVGLFFQGLWGDLRARGYYVELTSRSKARMYLYFLARIVRRMVKQ
jgi:hypothetical protein